VRISIAVVRQTETQKHMFVLPTHTLSLSLLSIFRTQVNRYSTIHVKSNPNFNASPYVCTNNNKQTTEIATFIIICVEEEKGQREKQCPSKSVRKQKNAQFPLCPFQNAMKVR
jgi:hypothetical protein